MGRRVSLGGAAATTALLGLAVVATLAGSAPQASAQGEDDGLGPVGQQVKEARGAADEAARRGKNDAAIEAFKKVLALVENPKLQKAFARAHRVGAHYGLACCCSLLGRTKEALDSLERAVVSGFEDWRHMAKDSDLDAIRADPRYKAILERAQLASLVWEPLPDPSKYDYRPTKFAAEEASLADPPAWYVRLQFFSAEHKGSRAKIAARWAESPVQLRRIDLEQVFKAAHRGDWEIERALKKPVLLPRTAGAEDLRGAKPPAWALGIDPAAWAAAALDARLGLLEEAALKAFLGEEAKWNADHAKEIGAYLEQKSAAYKEKVAAALKGEIKSVELVSVIRDPGSFAGKTVRVVGMWDEINESAPVFHGDDLSAGSPREALVVAIRPVGQRADACFALDGADWLAEGKAEEYRGLLKKRVEVVLYVKGRPADTEQPCVARVLSVKKK